MTSTRPSDSSDCAPHQMLAGLLTPSTGSMKFGGSTRLKVLLDGFHRYAIAVFGAVGSPKRGLGFFG